MVAGRREQVGEDSCGSLCAASLIGRIERAARQVATVIAPNTYGSIEAPQSNRRDMKPTWSYQSRLGSQVHEEVVGNDSAFGTSFEKPNR